MGTANTIKAETVIYLDRMLAVTFRYQDTEVSFSPTEFIIALAKLKEGAVRA